MLPSRIRPQNLPFRTSTAGRPMALYAAAAAGVLFILLAIWVLATINTPPTQTPITAEVSIKL